MAEKVVKLSTQTLDLKILTLPKKPASSFFRLSGLQQYHCCYYLQGEKQFLPPNPWGNILVLETGSLEIDFL